jgi:hypothetical protein
VITQRKELAEIRPGAMRRIREPDGVEARGKRPVADRGLLRGS